MSLIESVKSEDGRNFRLRVQNIILYILSDAAN